MRAREANSNEVAGVRISHPERVMYPEAGLTKLDLARYYDAIGDWIVPHVAGRPLTLVRCPDGHDGRLLLHEALEGVGAARARTREHPGEDESR